MPAASRIDSFGLTAGRKIGPRNAVEHMLGKGIEGEVYQVRELDTGIRRAAKLYFPHRNPKNKAVIWHARKLHALRYCPIVLQYHHSERITFRRQSVVCMISELCDGEPLEYWIARHRGGRLHCYQALSVLYHLVRGLEAVHALGEYHADVHSRNILIKPTGVRFAIKLVDFYNWGPPTRYKQRQDVMDCVRVFYECLGGRKHYAKQPQEVRDICIALRATSVLKKFPTLTALRKHLESFEWQTMLA